MSTGQEPFSEDDVGQDPAQTLAKRLDYLFKTIRKDGREYSNREVARAVTEKGGSPISHTTIGWIRRGQETNPKLSTLRGLSTFFGVPLEYFTSEAVAEEVEAEVELAAALAQIRENDQARTLVVRTRGLSAGGLRSVLQIVNSIRELEGLAEPTEPINDDR